MYFKFTFKFRTPNAVGNCECTQSSKRFHCGAPVKREVIIYVYTAEHGNRAAGSKFKKRKETPIRGVIGLMYFMFVSGNDQELHRAKKGRLLAVHAAVLNFDKEMSVE